MNLSEIKATLQDIRVSPVKSLGQNFLHDQNLSRWIVDQAEVGPDDYVVEIGPGLGALTRHLLARRAKVLAIEKDARLANFLRSHISSDDLEVSHLDALEIDVRTLFTKPKVKLIGNLPYYIASELLVRFLKFPSPISLSLLMLQKEMARRISAAPSTKDYGALTLLFQLHYSIEYLRTIAASVFIPRPDVDSAIVRLTPRSPLELPPVDHELFTHLVRLGFSQRRKQLGKLLREEISDWPRAADALGVDPGVRAEALSLDQWIALTNYVRPIQAEDHAGTSAQLFPVVDEEDQFLYDAPRAKVHANNLRHRAAHILIFSKNNEVFLQKRARWKDRHPLTWDSSAAGHVDAGESYDSAAGRELREELGIEVPLEKVAKLSASERTGQEFVWLYRGRHDGDLHLNRAEIEAGAFFPPAIVSGWIEARPADFASGFIECWNAYRQTSAV